MSSFPYGTVRNGLSPHCNVNMRVSCAYNFAYLLSANFKVVFEQFSIRPSTHAVASFMYTVELGNTKFFKLV